MSRRIRRALISASLAFALSLSSARAQDAIHSHETHRPARDNASAEQRHIPPDPPQHPMPDISAERMIEVMGMDDDAPFFMISFDELEWRDAEDDVLAWDAQAWFGDDYNKLFVKTEGVRSDHADHSRHELLWDRIVSRWWSAQIGVRHDLGEGPSRAWAAFGVQGLAPQWLEVEAAFYVGEQGRTAFRASVDQDLLLTQRWVLQPALELNAYGKDDAANGIGSGLADAEAGLRLRYEIRREIAPYAGVVYVRRFGETADLARLADRETSEWQWLAGIRVWF